MKRDRFRAYRKSDRTALARLFARADRHDRVARALAPSDGDALPLFAFAPRYPLGLERGLTRAEAIGRVGGSLAQVERHIFVAPGAAALDACMAVYPVRAGEMWMLDWVVDPERRDAVALDALLAAALDRVGAAHAPAAYSVEARGLREDADTAACLGQAGLRPARTFAILACDLDETSRPAGRVPQGVLARSYRPGDAPAWVAAFNAAFADHWGGFSYTQESWGRHVSSSRFQTELSLVAEADGHIIGVCHCTPSLNPREEGLAHLHILGVRPSFRRRRLGSYLMVEALARLRQGGFSRVELDMDTRNAGALRLYQQLGFRTREAITIYRRRVGTGSVEAVG